MCSNDIIKQTIEKEIKMRKIYIVLTYTGTILSKIIKTYTKDEFSHVSLSLDKKLEYMYSFGRLNPYNPFIGGFVHEGIDIGTFKRFKRTKTNIYSMQINEGQYNKLIETIKEIEKQKKQYKFNSIGLFAIGFNLKVKRKYAFYCAEFVKYLLEQSGIETNLPEMIRPEDFKNLENIKLEYRGKLRKYNKSIN